MDTPSFLEVKGPNVPNFTPVIVSWATCWLVVRSNYSMVSISWGFVHCHLPLDFPIIVVGVFMCFGNEKLISEKTTTDGMPILAGWIELNHPICWRFIGTWGPIHLYQLVNLKDKTNPTLVYIMFSIEKIPPSSPRGRSDVEHFIQRLRWRMGLAQRPGCPAEWTASRRRCWVRLIVPMEVRYGRGNLQFLGGP